MIFVFLVASWLTHNQWLELNFKQEKKKANKSRKTYLSVLSFHYEKLYYTKTIITGVLIRILFHEEDCMEMYTSEYLVNICNWTDCSPKQN